MHTESCSLRDHIIFGVAIYYIVRLYVGVPFHQGVPFHCVCCTLPGDLIPQGTKSPGDLVPLGTILWGYQITVTLPSL